jgi:hypothetical protein
MTNCGCVRTQVYQNNHNSVPSYHLTFPFISEPSRPLYRSRRAMGRYKYERQRAISLPFCAVLSGFVVVLESPPSSQAAIGKFLVEGLSVIGVQRSGSCDGHLPIRVEDIVDGFTRAEWGFWWWRSNSRRVNSFASVMLPPCFQFILLRVASGLQPLLLGWHD